MLHCKHYYRYYYYFLLFIYFFYFWATSTKSVGKNTEVRKMCNGCNGASLGAHGVLEGHRERNPSLKSHKEAVEQEGGFPAPFCDCIIIIIINITIVIITVVTARP